MKVDSGNLRSSGTPWKARRLIFSYDREGVKLVSQEPVEMTVPPSDPVEGFAGQKGFWAELKDDQDQTLYRRVLHNPMRPDLEVFSPDPEQTIARQPMPDRAGVFVVLVPDTYEAYEVALSGSPGAGQAFAATEQQAATEIARFKIQK